MNALKPLDLVEVTLTRRGIELMLSKLKPERQSEAIKEMGLGECAIQPGDKAIMPLMIAFDLFGQPGNEDPLNFPFHEMKVATKKTLGVDFEQAVTAAQESQIPRVRKNCGVEHRTTQYAKACGCEACKYWAVENYHTKGNNNALS